MRIESLNASHINELIELWSQSFILPYEQVSTWVSEKSIRNCIGAFENNKLVSALSIIPFEFYIRGRVLGLSGIGGVATFPEHRGKNYVHHLLKESIRISREKELIFSSLYPFSFEFYRIFGWELASFQKRYKRKTYNLGKFKEFENVKRMPLEDWNPIKPVYEKYAKNFTGPIRRTEERWESIIFRSRTLTYLYVYEEEGEIKGYVLYSVEKNGNMNKIVVREMITLNISAYKGFLGLFSKQSMSIEEVEWTAPLEDSLPFILPNPRGECSIEPTFMLRIIDVKKALSFIKYDENIKEKIVIYLKDDYADWNNGIWEIEIENGEGNIKKINSQDHDISLNINTFTQIVAGTLSPEKAYTLGLIEAKDYKYIEKLEKIFPSYPTFCWDYF